MFIEKSKCTKEVKIIAQLFYCMYCGVWTIGNWTNSIGPKMTRTKSNWTKSIAHLDKKYYMFLYYTIIQKVFYVFILYNYNFLHIHQLSNTVL